jgi:hypothetical protein
LLQARVLEVLSVSLDETLFFGGLVDHIRVVDLGIISACDAYLAVEPFQAIDGEAWLLAFFEVETLTLVVFKEIEFDGSTGDFLAHGPKLEVAGAEGHISGCKGLVLDLLINRRRVR